MCFSNLRGVVLMHGGLAGRNFPRLHRPHLGRRQSWCARFSGQGALEFNSFILNRIFLLSYPILIVDSPLGRKDGASRIRW